MNKIIFTFLSFLITAVTTAQVSFSVSSTKGCAPFTVTINNTSTAGDQFDFDFGDGSSTVTNPSQAFSTNYTYNKPGNYTINLDAFAASSYIGRNSINIEVLGSSDTFFMPKAACPDEKIDFRSPDYDAKSYKWYFGDGTPVIFNDDDDINHHYTSPGNYQVSLVTDFGACGIDSITQQIEIRNDVSVKSNIELYNPDNICINDEVTYYVNNINSKNYSYAWKFDNGNTSSSYYASTTYNTLGKKPMEVTLTNKCGLDTILYDTIDVVNSGIDLGRIDIDIHDAISCPGDNISFYAYADYDAAAFTWNIDGNTYSAEEVNYSYADTGNKIVSVNIKNGCGVDSTSFFNVKIKNDVPVDDAFILIPLPRKACINDKVNLLAFSDGGLTGEFVWSFGDGEFSTEKYPTHQYKTNGTKAISLIYTNGCGLDTVISTLVKVGNDHTPKLISSENDNGDDFNFEGFFSAGIGDDGGSSSSCIGDSVVFFVAGHVKATWDFGDGTSSNELNHIFIYGEGGDFALPVSIVKHVYQNNGIYNSKVTVFNECNNSITDSMPVTISNKSPMEIAYATLTNSNNNFYYSCDSIEFVAYNGQEYTWDFGDGTQVTTTKSEVKHAYTIPGEYRIQVSGKNACGFTDSDDFNILIQNGGTPVAKFESNVREGIAPLSVRFNNLSTDGLNYRWDFGDGTTSTERNPLHTYTKTGEFNVSLTAFGTCNNEDQSSVINYITSKAVSISGRVYNDTISDTIKSGRVFLFRKKVSGTFDTLAVTSIKSDGSYTFDNAIKGQYYVLARPNITDYPKTIPTYHGKSIRWFDADNILVTEDVDHVDIVVQSVKEIIGTHAGRVYGKVIEKPTKTGKINGPGDPFNGIDVSLIDKSTANPVSSSTSGDEGDFDMSNIPNSTYSLYVDVTGVPADVGFDIPINNSEVYIVVFVDSNEISYDTTAEPEPIDTIIDTTGSFVSAVRGDNLGLAIYPNPYTNFLTVEYELSNQQHVELVILNLHGQKVWELSKGTEPKGLHKFIIQKDILDRLDDINFFMLRTRKGYQVNKIVKVQQ